MALLDTRRLVIAGTRANSYLAMVGLDRAVIAVPSILYPALRVHRSRAQPAGGDHLHPETTTASQRDIPIYTAAVLAIGGLLATIGAAPNMLRVPSLGDDAAALQQALDGFQLWGNVRAVFQLGAFLAGTWAIVALGTPTPSARPGGEAAGDPVGDPALRASSQR